MSVTTEEWTGSGNALRRLAFGARVLVALLVIGAVGYAVASQWSEVRAAITSLAWSSVLLSAAAIFAGTVTSVLAWRTLLAEEGQPLSPLSAGRIFLVGQLGKYLPGSVWSIALQVELGRRAGVPRARAFTTSLVWVGLSLSTALTVGLLGLPVLAAESSGRGWWLLAALPPALVASHPRVLTRLVNLVLRGVRRPPLPRPLTWRGVLSAAGWLGLTWTFFGLHLWLLANALGAPGLGGFVRCLGGFALAMAAGVLFLLAPSGAGVREALLVAALSPVMSRGQALGVAVVSRMLFTAVDVAAAGLAALSGIRQVRVAAQPPSR
ncbi:MAG: lysylphosphatidylglycerol synthase domain-containing protein [Mycobacteriales bacterium]